MISFVEATLAMIALTLNPPNDALIRNPTCECAQSIAAL
jgi:hypothetical protein